MNALMLIKRINELQGVKFKGDKEIKLFIDKLLKNRNSENLWGWWNQGTTEFWISKYIIQTLLDAKDAGYSVSLNNTTLGRYLEHKVETAIADYRLAHKSSLSKGHVMELLQLMKRLGYDAPYHHYYTDIDALWSNKRINYRLISQQTLYKICLS